MASLSYLATLLWRKDDEDSISPKLRVRIKDNNYSPHGKFHRFLCPFSSKFSDLNFTSYVLYIYLYYVTCHTQWAWVIYAMIGQMASDIALFRFNDLGRSVTPTFLFRNRFYLQLSPHCPKMNEKINVESFVHDTWNPAILRLQDAWNYGR